MKSQFPDQIDGQSDTEQLPAALEFSSGNSERYIDVALNEELQSQLAFIGENPGERECAHRIAEIYYTAGDLECCLSWLIYCADLDAEVDPELQKLIESVTQKLQNLQFWD